MSSLAQFLNPSEAAKRLGVSTKALRLYEQRGLIAPVRTATGWRAYGPKELARGAEIVALREIGLSLAKWRARWEATLGALNWHLPHTVQRSKVAFVNSSTLLIKSAACAPT